MLFTLCPPAETLQEMVSSEAKARELTTLWCTQEGAREGVRNEVPPRELRSPNVFARAITTGPCILRSQA